MKSRPLRQKKNKKKIIPMIIGGVLLFTVLGFIIPVYGPTGGNSESEQILSTLDYNGRAFFQLADGRYATQISEENSLVINNNPLDLANIIIPNYLLQEDKVYIAHDGTEENIDFILEKFNNVILLQGLRPVEACTGAVETCPDVPLIQCSDSGQIINIIKSEINSITIDDNCLTFQGSLLYLDQSAEKYLLDNLGF